MREAEMLIVADREHLSSHTCRPIFLYLHSQNIVQPGLNKHGSRGRHRPVFFFSSALPPTVCLPLVQIDGALTSVKL